MRLAQRLETRLDGPVDDLMVQGYHELAGGLDPVAAGALHRRLLATRRFDESLFLSESDFDAAPQYTGVNPRPGRNVLEGLQADLAFVEGSAVLDGVLTGLLGPGYEVLLKKVVCGAPARIIPDWIKNRIMGNPVNNLGAYIKPEFRDITYFYGIDFHQDLIDYPDRPSDFLTVYVYLHSVGRHDAPLFVLEGSQALGGSLFPHALTQTPDGWRYGDGRGGAIDVRERALVGPAGLTALWHACTLHGAQPDLADSARLSLRYLFAKSRDLRTETGLDVVNSALAGPLSLAETRRDLNATGAAILKLNSINAMKA